MATRLLDRKRWWSLYSYDDVYVEYRNNKTEVAARLWDYGSGDYGDTIYTKWFKVNPTSSYRAVAYREDDYYTVLELWEDYTPTPPPTPSSISVPSTIKGGESITISWGSSSGATRYHLERSVNGGSFTQIYSGSSRSYTDTITKGWNTIAYRVRAYNTDGYSSYRTSPTRTIINFPEFNMKVDGALKTSENGWVKIDGALREIDSIWTKVDGILKEV